jgi:hypothetical protein
MSQSKVVFMLALLLALLATSAMARNLKRHTRDADMFDEPLFSLRDLYEITAQKRSNVHLSRDFHRSMSFLSMSLNEKISEEIEIELFY